MTGVACCLETGKCVCVCVCVCELRLLKGKQDNEPESPRFYFREERLLRWDSNPRPPVFKSVALPTEPPRQPSWLGSYYTSHARQSVQLALITG